MQCPHCAVDLAMSERQGVEIDYCPKCRGVWLDRGELDKIIERAVKDADDSAQPAPPPRAAPVQAHHPYPGDDDRYKHGHYRKKKKSFIEDIFDF